MFTYPLLTSAEQTRLPTLIGQPQAIPAKFEDSTHQIFYCSTIAGPMVLKVCQAAIIGKASFWSGCNHLFATDFPASLGSIQYTHDFLQHHGRLNVPAFVAAAAHRFVLSVFLAGQDIDADHVGNHTVIQLATHIAALHQHTYRQWGALQTPTFAANSWTSRLRETLVFLASKHGLPDSDPLLAEILARTNQIHETEFVPMMLDLRWDQLRDCDDHGLTLIDLDAFVIAPRGLDLVLLEYVLTPAQWLAFRQHYVHTHPWPDLTAQKPSYQLLLFLMNILGETDLAAWMQRI